MRRASVTSFLAALFTATSAVCVTGLIVVDTPTYWSTFGELVILVMIQLGGLGIMTVATLLLAGGGQADRSAPAAQRDGRNAGGRTGGGPPGCVGSCCSQLAWSSW